MASTSATSPPSIPNSPVATPVATSPLSQNAPLPHGHNLNQTVSDTDSNTNHDPPTPHTPWCTIFGNERRFLAIVNVPPNFRWLDAMRYLRVLLPKGILQGVRRIIRTVEAGEQIFWICCSSIYIATVVRGFAHARFTLGYPPLLVEFVHEDVWSGRASWGKEIWTRKTGLTLVPSGSQPPQAGASSHLNSSQDTQPLPSADFFMLKNPDDARHVTELAAAAPEAYQSIASRRLLYQRLEATGPPDDAVNPTRRQRRARERKHDGDDGAPSRLYEDNHSQGQESTAM